jgi:hypothetical protein
MSYSDILELLAGLWGVSSHHIVAYLLKARTVEPEKQPLLANVFETTFGIVRKFKKIGNGA